MSNVERHFFYNCRGADFFPSYGSVWDKSGGLPSVSRNLFHGLTQSMESDSLIFNGSTRISTWAHYNKIEVAKQMVSLKGIGINLLRIHLDLYCWLALGQKFIDRIRDMAAIATTNHMYIQWVLFDSYTKDDTPGISNSNKLHSIGGTDPASLSQAMDNGLANYQRCPTVFNHQLMTRDPSSMSPSGDAYIVAVASALSGSPATLTWEVMANIEFNSLLNPSDSKGYEFVLAVINKLRTVIPANQKITASFNNLKFKTEEYGSAESRGPVDLYVMFGDMSMVGASYRVGQNGGDGGALNSFNNGNSNNLVASAFLFQPSSSVFFSSIAGDLLVTETNLVVPPFSSIDIYAPRFEQIAPLLNNNPSYGLMSVPYGPEISFAASAVNYHQRPVYIIKLAMPETFIAAQNPSIVGASNNTIFGPSFTNWDIHSNQFFHKLKNWITSGINILENKYGKNRVILRGTTFSLGNIIPLLPNENPETELVPRIITNIQNLISQYRQFIVTRNIAGLNSKIIVSLPDKNFVHPGVPSYYPNLRLGLSNLSSVDSNLIIYDVPDPSTGGALSKFIPQSQNGDGASSYTGRTNILLGIDYQNKFVLSGFEERSTRSVGSIYNALDFLCYKGSGPGFIDKIFNYLHALIVAVTLNKSILAVGAGNAANLSPLHVELPGYFALGLGFISDGIIDRNLGNKPFNGDRGLLFENNTYRDRSDVFNLNFYSRILNGVNSGLVGRQKAKQQIYLLPSSIFEIDKDYDLGYVIDTPYASSSMTRFSQFGTDGRDYWEYMKTMLGLMPDLLTNYFYIQPAINFKSIGTKYATYNGFEGSKSQGYGISDYGRYIFKNELPKFGELLSPLVSRMAEYFNGGTNGRFYLGSESFAILNNFTPGLGDYQRDRIANLKIKFLEKFQEGLPIPQINKNFSDPLPAGISQYFLNMVHVSAQNNLINAYAPFAPPFMLKDTVSSISPIIGTGVYISGISEKAYTNPNSIEGLYLGQFLQPLSACQKPACYFFRGEGFASGSCIYLPTANVNPNITIPQDVINKLDWAEYDRKLVIWFSMIVECWKNVQRYEAANVADLQTIVNSVFSYMDTEEWKMNNTSLKPSLKDVL